MFRVFQYVKIHHRHGIHKKPQLRHQIGAFRDGLPCFFLWTISLCYRCEWFAKVWYAKKEFLWGLSVFYVKYPYQKKNRQLSHINVFFHNAPWTLFTWGWNKGTLQRYKMTCFSAYQGRGLSAFHPWMAWTKSKHVTTAITTFKSWLFIDNSWQQNKWIQMVLWWEQAFNWMMIHQPVSPYIKYTSLILFEVIVEADVWICFGKLLDFWSISVTISVIFSAAGEHHAVLWRKAAGINTECVYPHLSMV